MCASIKEKATSVIVNVTEKETGKIIVSACYRPIYIYIQYIISRHSMPSANRNYSFVLIFLSGNYRYTGLLVYIKIEVD